MNQNIKDKRKHELQSLARAMRILLVWYKALAQINCNPEFKLFIRDLYKTTIKLIEHSYLVSKNYLQKYETKDLTNLVAY